MKRRAALVGAISATGALGAVGLSGCATGPAPAREPRSQAALAPLVLPAGGRAYTLDAAVSRLRLVVFRAGPLARLGHHHLIEAAPDGGLRGQLWLPDRGWDGAQGEIAVPLATLRIDEAAWRREAGGEFDERPIAAEDIAATRRNLLALLQADAHPEARLRLRRLGGSPPYAVAELALELAGRVSLQAVALRWQVGDALRISGRFPLSLQALDLRPPSVLGGGLRVDDAVLLEAELVFRPSSDRASTAR